MCRWTALPATKAIEAASCVSCRTLFYPLYVKCQLVSFFTIVWAETVTDFPAGSSSMVLHDNLSVVHSPFDYSLCVHWGKMCTISTCFSIFWLSKNCVSTGIGKVAARFLIWCYWYRLPDTQSHHWVLPQLWSWFPISACTDQESFDETGSFVVLGSANTLPAKTQYQANISCTYCSNTTFNRLFLFLNITFTIQKKVNHENISIINKFIWFTSHFYITLHQAKATSIPSFLTEACFSTYRSVIGSVYWLTQKFLWLMVLANLLKSIQELPCCITSISTWC